MSFVTPYSEMLEDGQYEVAFPLDASIGGKNYVFGCWEDGSANPTRLINLNADMNIGVNYLEVINLANVTFNVALSAQMAPTPVTIKVTLPSATVETLPIVNTNAGGSCTTTKAYLAGNYSAMASVPADAQYKAVSSVSVPFTVGLEDRTIVLAVVVG